ncbi:MAG: DsbA family protein [Candidatus Absconditabacteria bacterium]|nr:DsbA family protein [Candidatus Absconditabacteria bacterium]MDD3868131.1 DsbA family protein [Candidatus Absconditabacteria bacterium]MDD4714517.1 DsbA family protein [Candidatus Absconditabacteria bacterium]
MTKETGASCKKCGSIVVAILLIANIVLSALAYFYAYKNYDLEIIKTGGKENFEILNEYYKSEAYISEVSASLAGINGETPTGDIASVGETATLDQASIQALKNTSKVLGDPDATITIIEFGDVNCSFCQRQIAQDRTIQTVMANNSDVNVIYKNMALRGSVPQSQVIECVGAQTDVDTYYSFMEAVYGASDISVENLIALSETFGADTAEVQACVDEERFTDLINTHIAEGNSFGFNGTPTSIIINNDTGEYEMINGAYPVDEFERVIAALTA